MDHFELCRMCGSSQEMAVTGFHTVSVDSDGEPHTTDTVAYHCKSCGALARYEHFEEKSAMAHERG